MWSQTLNKLSFRIWTVGIFAYTPQKPDDHLYIHRAKFYSLFFEFVSFNFLSCSAASYSHSRDFLELYIHPKTDKLPRHCLTWFNNSIWAIYNYWSQSVRGKIGRGIIYYLLSIDFVFHDQKRIIPSWFFKIWSSGPGRAVNPLFTSWKQRLRDISAFSWFHIPLVLIAWLACKDTDRLNRHSCRRTNRSETMFKALNPFHICVCAWRTIKKFSALGFTSNMTEKPFFLTWCKKAAEQHSAG